MAAMPEITGVEVVDDTVVGREGGFLAVRRTHLRNRRADGSLSAAFLCDFIVRPYGQDAVVVIAWHRGPDGKVGVLLRECLRPTLWLGRDAAAAPLPEARRLFLTEAVAGILETGDVGEAGLRARAVAELAEEAGFHVEPSAIQLLGAGTHPSPGAMFEKFYIVAVEVDPSSQREPEGDGSPMEEAATTRWLELDTAIAACVRGELEDAKTELGLRRLRDVLERDRAVRGESAGGLGVVAGRTPDG
jgi:ADP-ribose pyrophosphatase